MSKNKSLIASALWLLVDMVVFCSLWLLFYREPFWQNLFYAMALFVGVEIIYYGVGKIIRKMKNNHD